MVFLSAPSSALWRGILRCWPLLAFLGPPVTTGTTLAGIRLSLDGARGLHGPLPQVELSRVSLPLSCSKVDGMLTVRSLAYISAYFRRASPNTNTMTVRSRFGEYIQRAFGIEPRARNSMECLKVVLSSEGRQVRHRC